MGLFEKMVRGEGAALLRCLRQRIEGDEMRVVREVLPAVLALSAFSLSTGCLDLPGYGGPDGSTDTDTDADSDTDTDTDTDADTDTDTGTDTDADTDTDTDTGIEMEWCDDASGLCWQNPPSDSTFNWEAADGLCTDLSLGGHDDWRLPKIQELITLIAGCVNGIATGGFDPSICGVTDPDCLGATCDDLDCADCPGLEGPSTEPDGCYWVPELMGPCYFTWSSSAYAAGLTEVWGVYFNSGHVANAGKGWSNYVRCVRPYL
jgi:hypothetical protein